MNDRAHFPTRPADPDDIGCNESNNPGFDAILNARISRRNFLGVSAGSGAMALFGGVSLSALAGCGGGGGGNAVVEQLLGFSPVAKTTTDAVTLPAGYSYSVINALGDPLRAATAAYMNDGSDGDYENRFGDHHDGMEYFGLSASGTPDPTSGNRALIGMNHEATTDMGSGNAPSYFLHATGGTPGVRPAAEVDKETAIHGITVYEVRKTNGQFAYVADSAFNFRIHQNTPVEIHGPARGHALVKTLYSNDGTMTRGTLNNCGTGKTPWGTLITGEENWSGYYFRNGTDNAARGGDKSVTSLNRYGRSQGAASRHGWETAGPEDRFMRWNISLTGVSVDGTDDYRNEMNGVGYQVEIDPYDKTRAARKRTALGRFAHESASFSVPASGMPLAVYQGDDARGEYIYKWVSAATWDPADASAADRLAIGDKYLNTGKLYAARFNADGSGDWLELAIGVPAIAGYATYPFADQADVCVNARIAADAVGATKMDRPEWSAVNPANGEVYFTLTNNTNRRLSPTGSQVAPDAANPRVYSDVKGTTSVSTGNVHGHIIRLRETGGLASALTFTWDVYLFGAESTSGTSINLSSLTADQDLSSPDGLSFTPSTGICWIQTDDGAYTDVTNCMMLAALPGQVGDGGPLTVSGTGITTYMGAKPTADTLKRFLIGPKGCEITGICEAPDGKALFINIQHPGENTGSANVSDPTKYESHWPSNAGYGAGQRPRSATIVITKNDGGRIGT